MLPARNNASKIVKLIGEPCFDKVVLAAANVLKQGKIIAVPTDTIYGIAALAQCDEAIKAIYKLKERDCRKPLAICVGRVPDVTKWGKISFSKQLLYELLPGPVTVVLERQPGLNPALNPNVRTIGIRIPKSEFIQNLSIACNEPLALTSANMSSMLSSLAIEEFSEIWPFLDLIVDGGSLGHQDPHRVGSTIVDLSKKGTYKILRQGCALENTIRTLHKHHLKEVI